MPQGFIDKKYRDPLNFTREEWQQAKRTKEEPRMLKALFIKAWKVSDNRTSFAQALREYGLILARGDKRGYVAVDYKGQVYSLSRWVGLKPKELKARLGDTKTLPSIADAKAEISERMQVMLERHREEIVATKERKLEPLKGAVKLLTKQHKEKRERLVQKHKQRWQQEHNERQARLPRGFKGIWHRITGEYQKVRRQNEAETVDCAARDARETLDLIRENLRHRQRLNVRIRKVRHDYYDAMLNLRLEAGQYLEMHANHAPNLTESFNRQNIKKNRHDRGFDIEM